MTVNSDARSSSASCVLHFPKVLSHHKKGGGGDFQSTFESPSENGSPHNTSLQSWFLFYFFILLGLKHYWGVPHFQILIIDLVFGGGRGLFFQYLHLCDQLDQKCPEVSTIKLPLDLLVNMYTVLFCFLLFFKCTDFSLLFPWLFFCYYTTIKPCGWLATVQEVWCLNQ